MAERAGRSGTRWSALIACAAMIGIFAPVMRAQTGGIQPVSTAWNYFSADISIRQAIVGANGQPLRTPPPAIALRMLRTLAPAGWKTTLTLVSQEAPLIGGGAAPAPLDNPFLVGRVEYDGDGTPPRFYNTLGQPLASPAAADRQLLVTPQSLSRQPIDWDAFRTRFGAAVVPAQSSAWIDGMIATPAKRAERRLAIEAQFGRTTGRTNGFDRYIAMSGSLMSELLVRPDMAVPTELNQTDGGVLVGRILFGYDTRGDGTLIRRLVHAERLVDEQPGARSIVDVETTNVLVRAGGAR